MILGGVRQALGPDYDVATHFTPRYNPWDQRLCLVPNGDLFASIRSGQASVVTDQIETFTQNGLKLASGAELDADIVVTATGLDLAGAGRARSFGRWTPNRFLEDHELQGADVQRRAKFCGGVRLHQCVMDAEMRPDLRLCLPPAELHGPARLSAMHAENTDPSVTEEPLLNFYSGYVQRAIARMPKQGSKKPWKLYQNYALDIVSLKFGSMRDDAMKFSDSRKIS